MTNLTNTYTVPDHVEVTLTIKTPHGEVFVTKEEPHVNTPPTGTVTIDNMQPVVGDTLTFSDTLADHDGIAPGAITHHVQRADESGEWLDIATGTAYTTSQEDAGFRLRVDARYVDERGAIESVHSEPTAPVEVPNAPLTGVPTLSDMNPTIDSRPIFANTSDLKRRHGRQQRKHGAKYRRNRDYPGV
jgi:hypothetical protein